MGDVWIEERATTADAAARGPVTAAVGGAFIVVCAAVAASAVAVSELVLTPEGPGSRLHYPPLTWPLLPVLAVAGVVAMTRHRWARAAALLAAVVAAQTAGFGLIAVRAWFGVTTFGGSGSLTATPITYAAAVAMAATAAAVAGAAMVWREPAGGWRGLVPARPLYVAAGAAVVALLPRIWNAELHTGDITGLDEISTLTYSLPWGVGLFAAGWLRGRSAVAAGATVTVAAVLCASFVAAVHLLGYATYPLGD